MNDRELLEAAAKAAGMETKWDQPRGASWGSLRARLPGEGPAFPIWNPLHDDAHALRLAIALRLTVAVRFNECEVFEADFGECAASEPIFTASSFIRPDQATDPAEATRRAIVRAAAAIGGAK